MIDLNKDKPVVVIAPVETFSVKGVEMKLKGLGIQTVYAELDIKSIENNRQESELFVYYMDETVGTVPEVLVYLKDLCRGADRRLILIGSKGEYEVATKILPETAIVRWFERPLNMEDFLEAVSHYLAETSPEGRAKTLLIVDDDVTYMRMIREWLDGSYRVAMVNSGIQAITWLAKNKADLILLDYEMPITSGPQVLEMLRSEPETARIPVIFLTGKGDRDSIMKVLELKPDDYLLKTIDRASLIQKLEMFFQKRR